MEILFNDPFIAVCIKDAGVNSETDGKAGMPDLLRERLGGEIFPVHRLDKNVGGIMVFARNRAVAAALSAQIQNGEIKKRYKALCYETPENGEMIDLLFKDSAKRKAFIVRRMRKGVKEARLTCEVEAIGRLNGRTVSLVDIALQTGRFHQIRAQLASRSCPLVGDGKYGAKDNFPAPFLFAYSLSFIHPESGEALRFESDRWKSIWSEANGGIAKMLIFS